MIREEFLKGTIAYTFESSLDYYACIHELDELNVHWVSTETALDGAVSYIDGMSLLMYEGALCFTSNIIPEDYEAVQYVPSAGKPKEHWMGKLISASSYNVAMDFLNNLNYYIDILGIDRDTMSDILDTIYK